MITSESVSEDLVILKSAHLMTDIVTHLLTTLATCSNLATKVAHSRLGRLDGALLDTGSATTGGGPKVAVHVGSLGGEFPNV